MSQYCETCGHKFSDVCGSCTTLDGVPVNYTEKENNLKELTIVVTVGKEVYGAGCYACDVFVTDNCTFSANEHILNRLYYVKHDRLVDNWLELDDVSNDIAIAIRKRMYDELKKEKEE